MSTDNSGAVIVRDMNTGEIDVINPNDVLVTGVTDPRRLIEANDSMEGLRGQLMKAADDSIELAPGTPETPQEVGETFVGADGKTYMVSTISDENGNMTWAKTEVVPDENGYPAEILGEPQPFDIDEYRKAKSNEIDAANRPQELQRGNNQNINQINQNVNQVPENAETGTGVNGNVPEGQKNGQINQSETPLEEGQKPEIQQEGKGKETQQQQSVSSRIPVDDKGKKVYEEATPEDTLAELTEKYGEEKANQMIAKIAESAARELDKLEQTDTSSITDMADLEAHEDRLTEARKKAEYWQDLVRRKQDADARMAEAVVTHTTNILKAKDIDQLEAAYQAAKASGVPENALSEVYNAKKSWINLVNPKEIRNFATDPESQAKWVDEHIDEIVDSYIKTHGNVLDPDKLRDALTPIGYNGKNVPDFKKQGKRLTKAVYEKMLQDAVASGNRSITLLTGAGGAGKSKATESMDFSDRGVVYDSAFNNVKSLKDAINDAKAAGMTDVRVVAVYNDAYTSFNNTVERGLRTGRFLSLDYFVREAFMENQGKIAELKQSYPDVDIVCIDNSGNKSTERPEGGRVSVEEAANWDYTVNDAKLNELLDIFENGINEGRFTEDQAASIGRGLHDVERAIADIKSATVERIGGIERRIRRQDDGDLRPGVSGEPVQLGGDNVVPAADGEVQGSSKERPAEGDKGASGQTPAAETGADEEAGNGRPDSRPASGSDGNGPEPPAAGAARGGTAFPAAESGGREGERSGLPADDGGAGSVAGGTSGEGSSGRGRGAEAKAGADKPEVSPAKKKVYQKTVEASRGRNFTVTLGNGNRSVITIDRIDHEGKVVLTRQDYDPQGNPIGEPRQERHPLEMVGRAIVESKWNKELTTEEKLRGKYKFKVGDVPVLDVLTEDEQQQILDAIERGDKEAVGNLTGDFIQEHRNDIILRGRDQRNQRVEKAFVRGSRAERLDGVRNQYNGFDNAKAMLDNDSMQPQSIEEYVADALGDVPKPGNGFLAYESYDQGGNTIEGMKNESGFGSRGFNGDTKGFNPWLAPKGKGKSLKQFAESIHESLPEGMKEQFSDQDIRNIIYNILTGAEKPTDIANYILRNRVKEAEAEARHEEDGWMEEPGYQKWVEKVGLTDMYEHKVEQGNPAFDSALQKLDQREISIDDPDLLKEYGLKNVTLSRLGDHVTLTHFVVDNQGQGNGTRFMEDLARLADEKGWTLDLTPDTSFGATSIKRLKDFYKRFGFKDNKGRNTDFFTRESMVRRPKDWQPMSPEQQEKVLRDAVVDHLRQAGIEVSTDWKVGQRILDDYNSRMAVEDPEAEIKPQKTDEPMFFKTKDGHAYGYTYKGKIYLDPRIAMSETPVHEYGHLWAEMKRQTSPEEWDDIKRVMLTDKLVQPIIDRVKRDYPELSKDGREDDFIEEVITQFSGKRGAERLREIANEIAAENGGVFGKAEAVTAMQRLKNILNRFWEGVAKMMGWKYRNANQIADRILADMLNDVDPTEKIKAEKLKMKPQKEDTAARDKEYADAVAAGDKEKVDAMLREEAARKGYSEDSSYQGSIAFNGAAPSRNGYFETREERKEAMENGTFEDTFSLGDYAEAGIDANDLEWQLTNPRAASAGDQATLESICNLNAAIKGKTGKIKMYRAVDAAVKENSFRNGDWVTPSRRYAEQHIELQDWKKGRIIEEEVPVDDIWWNGDDINEWGYDDGKGYAYKNTRNNRKLMEPTYDDKGNLIPLSQRFNERKSDIRFQKASNPEPFKLSEEKKDAEGNRMYERNNSIDLWTATPLLAKARRQQAPVRLSERNMKHIISRHSDRLDTEEKVFSFLDNVFANATILRKAKGRGMFVVVENKNTDSSAMIKLMPSDDGDYYNIDTAGFYRKDKWKDSEEVIADLSEPDQSDAVADASKPQVPNENGRELINAEAQISSSEGKVTKNIPNDQENQQKSSPIGKTSSPEAVQAEESRVNTSPTDAQKEAGNYQKGHINIDGYDITIENPKGSVRSGVDSKGNRWESTMHNTYGYIRGTEGVDGDHIDVFLSDNPASGNVYVIDQVNPDTGEFDEHKIVYGYASEEEARQAYLSNYGEGWKGLGNITEVSRETFRQWIKSSHRKTKPFAEYKSVKANEPRFQRAGSPEPEMTPEERQYWNKWDADMKKWRERNAIGETATGPSEKPRMQQGESALDYAKRLVQWNREKSLWQTAPKLEDYRQRREDKDVLEAARENEKRYPDSPSAKMRRVAAEFQQIRRAMSRQKAYDKATVKAVTDFAQEFMRMGFGDNLSRGDVERLLSSVKNATGASDIKKHVDNIMRILTDNYLKNLKAQVNKLASVKELKQTAQGVDKQGKLELKGQRMIQAFREAAGAEFVSDVDDLTRSTAEVDAKVGDLRDRLAKISENMEQGDPSMWEEEYEGVSLALQYFDNIARSQATVTEYKKLREDAVKLYKGSGRDYKAQQELLESYDKAIEDEKISRIGMYGDMINRLHGNISESMKGAREFNEKKRERVKWIHTLAARDMDGIDADTDHEQTWKTRLNNSAIPRLFLGPTATFEQMLKSFGRKNANGEGWLYNEFMRGYIDSVDREQVGREEVYKALDSKVSEIFGKKMRLSDLYGELRNTKKYPEATVEWLTADGEMKKHTLSQGQMLDIYMWNKQPDGVVKLREQGITEEKVTEIKNALDPKLIQLADWFQGELSPKLREKYSKVYERVFGAAMPAVENYFPLRIIGDSITRDIDVTADPNSDNVLPSNTTGAIIRRKVNTKPLDILGTDMVSLIIEHVDNMEKWAAFVEWYEDINALLSYNRFKNQVKNSGSIYGSGDKQWENFRKAAQIAAGTYRPTRSEADKAITTIASGVTGAKIAFRPYTALKQLLSAPAFMSDASAEEFAKCFMNPKNFWYDNIKWAMENLPALRKRWHSRDLGDTRLMDTTGWGYWDTKVRGFMAQYGMAMNGAIDVATCAAGARAIYRTRLERYRKQGMSDEQANKRALQDAEIGYNLTQQSSEGAFVSAVQKDRTLFANMWSVFRNSSMAYTRQSIDAVRNLRHLVKYKGDSIEFMKRQLEAEGLSSEEAQKAAREEYRRAYWHNAVKLAVSAWVLPIFWELGSKVPYLALGGDDEEKKDMVNDVLRKELVSGPGEGLMFGQAVNGLWGAASSRDIYNTYKNEGFGKAAKEGLKQMAGQETSPLPLFSDMGRLLMKFSKDEAAGLQDMVNLAVQMGTGLNPQTITDPIVAAIDATRGDLGLAKETELFLLRLLMVPEESAKNIYIDEVGMTADKAKKLSFDEAAERYAKYKTQKGAPFFSWMYDDDGKKKRRDSYVGKFTEDVRKRIDRLNDEELLNTLGRTRDPEEKALLVKMAKKRLNVSDTQEEDSKKPKQDKDWYQKEYSRMMDGNDLREDELLSGKLKGLYEDYNKKHEEAAYKSAVDEMDFYKANKGWKERLDKAKEEVSKRLDWIRDGKYDSKNGRPKKTKDASSKQYDLLYPGKRDLVVSDDKNNEAIMKNIRKWRKEALEILMRAESSK